MAFVVAIGISMLVATLSSYKAMVAARSDFYHVSHFADVFVFVKQFPASLLEQIKVMPGVRAAEGRIIREVLLDLPGKIEPATGRLISLPPYGQRLNILFLRSGHLPRTMDEVVINEAFALANRLEAGSKLFATMNGRSYELRVVGTALSPEYVFAFRGSNPMPDDAHFGVLWLPEALLAGAYNMRDTYNDLTLTLDTSRSEDAIIKELDALLEIHGGTGAYGRMRQSSHMFLHDEINQLKATAVYMPLIFLGVAAFLLHVVVGRLIARQREVVATLRALGYRQSEIVSHYAMLIGCIVCAGFIPGILYGIYLGGAWTALYQEYYRFPTLTFELSTDVLFAALLAALIAGFAGGVSSLRSILRLDPAVAMRPPAPPDFRHGILDRLGLSRVLSVRLRIAVRLLVGRPLRTVFAVTGMSFAVMIMIVGLFWLDAFDHMLDLQFNFQDRSSATLILDRPSSERSLEELALLPGVIRVEGSRAVPIKITNETKVKNTVIMGLHREALLRRVLSQSFQPVRLPATGLLMNRGMASRLGLRPGDLVSFQLLEKGRQTFRVRLVGLVEELLGAGVYMEAGELRRLLDEEGLVNSATVHLDARTEEDFMRIVKRYPGISAVSLRSTALASFTENMERMLLSFVFILTLLAGAIAVGIVYNTAVVTLSEQMREFGTLRVLGFHRKEVFGIFLFELLVLLGLSLPLGAFLGYISSRGLLLLIPTETFTIPLIISGRTYMYAFLLQLASVLLTLWLVWRKIKTMDFISVLKLHE